jgi:hypothetical protein
MLQAFIRLISRLNSDVCDGGIVDRHAGSSGVLFLGVEH